MSKTASEVVGMKEKVKMVDLRFTDLLGLWHHFTMPARELAEDLFEEGIGFDGSSIRAFQEIHESDMILDPGSDHRLYGPDGRDADPGASSVTSMTR